MRANTTFNLKVKKNLINPTNPLLSYPYKQNKKKLLTLYIPHFILKRPSKGVLRFFINFNNKKENNMRNNKLPEIGKIYKSINIFMKRYTPDSIKNLSDNNGYYKILYNRVVDLVNAIEGQKEKPTQEVCTCPVGTGSHFSLCDGCGVRKPSSEPSKEDDLSCYMCRDSLDSNHCNTYKKRPICDKCTQYADKPLREPSKEKSIWKPISVLPEGGYNKKLIYFKDKNNNIKEGLFNSDYWNNRTQISRPAIVSGDTIFDFDDLASLRGWCLVSDFINQQQSLEERITKLELLTLNKQI